MDIGVKTVEQARAEVSLAAEAFIITNPGNTQSALCEIGGNFVCGLQSRPPNAIPGLVGADIPDWLEKLKTIFTPVA